MLESGNVTINSSGMKLLVIVIVLFSSSVNCKDTCTQDPDAPPCVCTKSDGSGKIDLRPLARDDGTAAFKDIPGKGQDTYSYNPCYDFTDGGCENVAGCQNSGGKRSIGTQKTADIQVNDRGIASIAYAGGQDGRNMIVDLVCSKTQEVPMFQFENEPNENQYVFKLTTKCACPGTCSGGGGGGGGGQSKSHRSSSSKIGVPGLIILSLFVILIIVYFVAGMIIMRVKYEKTGSDIIPNKGFWTTLPFLVKDGVVLTFTPCTRCYRNRIRGYSKF